MIFALDTNVVSERAKPEAEANPLVMDFFRRCPAENLRLPSMALAEVASGVENQPTPALRAFLGDLCEMPSLAFGEAEALAWGQMVCAALKAGQSVKARDSIIAACALANGCAVATRNGADFAGLGVTVFNPFAAKLP
jgi:predicted nucleic acid-binding protein